MPLKGDYFENETFADLDLQGELLSKKEFYKCTFQRSKFQEGQFDQLLFEESVFEGCDLSNLKIKQVSARNLKFNRCKLMGVDWSTLSINPELGFSDCNMRYSAFSKQNLRTIVFKTCLLTEANFLRVDLRNANFTDSDLTGVRFEACDLGEALFNDAKGAMIDPTQNKVKNARISLESALLICEYFGMELGDAPA